MSHLQPKLNKTLSLRQQPAGLTGVADTVPWNYGILGNRVITPLLNKNMDEEQESLAAQDMGNYDDIKYKCGRVIARNLYLDY